MDILRAGRRRNNRGVWWSSRCQEWYLPSSAGPSLRTAWARPPRVFPVQVKSDVLSPSLMQSALIKVRVVNVDFIC